MVDYTGFVERLYDRFNARDMEALLAVMHEDVVWANGMEGGHLVGRDAVRQYWSRQWTLIDPRVDPAAITTGPDGEVIVEVHQHVCDLDGRVLADRMIGHIFRLEGGLIRRFDIRDP
jgi:ketosteroid isomerase-like protein